MFAAVLQQKYCSKELCLIPPRNWAKHQQVEINLKKYAPAKRQQVEINLKDKHQLSTNSANLGKDQLVFQLNRCL